jgi:hypothetical protein
MTDDTAKPTLEDVSVSRACPADWEAMEGDEQVRYCHLCQLNVYNLSGMSRQQALELVRSREGERLCVRFYRRTDGTVITDECPAGLKVVRRRLTLIAVGVTAAVAAVGSWFGYSVARARGLPTLFGKPRRITQGQMCLRQ